MAEVAQDIRQLQKLDKVDLVVLLGRLEEELERLEASNADTAKENNVLDMRNRELFEQNQTLSAQLQQTNQRLVEKETVAKEWQDMKECLRLMVEANKQMREDMRGMREAYEGLRVQLADSSGNAYKEIKTLVNEFRKQSAETIRQRAQVDMKMLDGIQQAIDQARSSYGELENGGLTAPSLPDLPAEGGKSDETLTTQQAELLGRILSRIHTAEQA